MCIFKDKWPKDFEPTKQYLSVVSRLTSVLKLYNYSKDNFVYIAEKIDHWCDPIEFMENGGGDCENWTRWYVDILVRIQKKEDARFIIHSGYNKKRWGDELHHHAICVFKYQGKYAVLDVKQFASGYESHLVTGYRMFPDGITRMVVRDWQGKILEKKRKWIGTF